MERMWEDLGVVGWISEIRKSLEQKNGKPENHEVPDGVPHGSRCDRTGRDRSVSEASDEVDGFGAFWKHFGTVDFGEVPRGK